MLTRATHEDVKGCRHGSGSDCWKRRQKIGSGYKMKWQIIWMLRAVDTDPEVKDFHLELLTSNLDQDIRDFHLELLRERKLDCDINNFHLESIKTFEKILFRYNVSVLESVQSHTWGMLKAAYQDPDIKEIL